MIYDYVSINASKSVKEHKMSIDGRSLINAFVENTKYSERTRMI